MNKKYRWLAAWLIPLLLCWQMPAYGIDQLSINVGQWFKQQVHGQQLKVEFVLNQDGLGLTGSAKQIQLPKPWGIISQVKLQCKKVAIQAQQFSCTDGKLAFKYPKLGVQQLRFSLTAKPQQMAYRVVVSGLKLAGGVTHFNLKWHNQQWQLQISSPRLAIKSLKLWLQTVLLAKQVAQLKPWQLDGAAKVKAELYGHNKQLRQADLQLALKALNVADKTGNYATDNVDANIDLHTKQDQGNWHWRVALKLPTGQSYINPVFVDLAATPLMIKAKGDWQQSSQLLSVTNAQIKQDKVMQLNVDGQLQTWQLKKLRLKLACEDVNQLYRIWGQPFLLDTALAKLKTNGKLSVKADWDNKKYTLQTKLDKVTIDDTDQRFGLTDLSGTAAWTNRQQSRQTDLHWQHGHIYDVPLGASRLQAQVASSQLQLTEPLTVPILDGALQINNLQLTQAAKQGLAWSFDGLLSPISMDALSEKLGWPLLHGKLSGVIPKVTYQQHQVQVDGALMVKLFGGTTVIRDLRMTTPFGALPQLYANIDLQGLDLALLTQTFDFGRITGKLNGKVKNLRLSDWQPVQFDAEFATPDDDKSSHRISQRAVNNLSQIGGGASGVLSRSFLRFFKDFSYKRLGIKCQLRNDVCEMSGVGAAKQGYYLVKGGGGLPPWIDVIGYTRRVDWKELIARLEAVRNSSGPVIK